MTKNEEIFQCALDDFLSFAEKKSRAAAGRMLAEDMRNAFQEFSPVAKEKFGVDLADVLNWYRNQSAPDGDDERAFEAWKSLVVQINSAIDALRPIDACPIEDFDNTQNVFVDCGSEDLERLVRKLSADLRNDKSGFNVVIQESKLGKYTGNRITVGQS